MTATQTADGPSAFLLSIQAFVTLVFGPLAFLFNMTVVADIAATSPWLNQHDVLNPTGETKLMHFLVLVLIPALSFMGSCYILVSYWMDQDRCASHQIYRVSIHRMNQAPGLTDGQANLSAFCLLQLDVAPTAHYVR